ncbi:MAG: class I SAM-dependent methyltransferase [Anaerolineae bacterium]|nr:class I SAM-dependent methyltransferase [Anaerolineae bacterium]
MFIFPRRWRFFWRYLRGNTPWDSGIVPPEIIAWVAAYESAERPPGRALDLGCGTGTTSRFLAAHGWDVTGLDFAANAVGRARREARRQAFTGRVIFLSADVSRPDLLPDALSMDLVIDVGCLHGLTPEQRSGYAANITRLARPGATYLLYAFMPGPSRDGRREIGLNSDRLQALLGPAFELVEATLSEDTARHRASGWYTFRRTDDTP